MVGTHKRVDEPSNKAADTSGEGSIDSNADSSKADGSQAGNSEQRQRRRELRQQPRRPRNSSGDQASTLFVQNLAWATMDEDLKEHFSGCEGLADAFITFNKEGRPSGVGFVRFDSPAAAAAAAKVGCGRGLGLCTEGIRELVVWALCGLTAWRRRQQRLPRCIAGRACRECTAAVRWALQLVLL